MNSDRELLDAIALKDNKSFRIFYCRYELLVSKKILDIMKDREAAEDLCQDFWLLVWVSPAIIKTNQEGSAIGFIIHFLTLRSYYSFRSPHRKMVMVDDFDEVEQKHRLQYTHVFEELEEKEIEVNIDRILETLPEISRQVYDLCRRKHYSVAEVAQRLSTTEGHVRSKLSWTLRILRVHLSASYLTKASKSSICLMLIVRNLL